MNWNLNNIIEGDCLTVLQGVASDTFQMTFADPPFNLDKKYAAYKDNKGQEEYLEWCDNWITEMVRVTKPGGSLFLHNIPKWLVKYACFLDAQVDFRHWIAWDASTSPMGKSLQPAHYGILYYTKPGGDVKINELRMPHKRCRSCNVLLKDYGGKKNTIYPFGPLVSDVWTDIFRYKHDRYRDKHPCQLPVHLLERLILLSTDEDDEVFDPFMGTGTTAIAAKRLGRKFFGSELSSMYVDAALSKLEKESIPSCFNGIWISCYLEKFHTARHCDIWDAEKKEFRPEWIDLYDQWPYTDDARKELNFNQLKLKLEYKKEIKEICERK